MDVDVPVGVIHFFVLLHTLQSQQCSPLFFICTEQDISRMLSISNCVLVMLITLAHVKYTTFLKCQGDG